MKEHEFKAYRSVIAEIMQRMSIAELRAKRFELAQWHSMTEAQRLQLINDLTKWEEYRTIPHSCAEAAERIANRETF